MRIDLVSPLPPVRSGIADYSADLLPHLTRLCDVRLIRLPDQKLAPEIAGSHEVGDGEDLGGGGRLPFFQMGNNRYHTAVFDLACASARRGSPGVVTLHDVVLHHFLIERTLQADDFDAYREAMAEEHGWIGEAAALPRRWPGGWADAALFALPAHRRLLTSQRGVLVHSEWAADWLREEIPGIAVRAVPMGVPPGKVPDPASGLEFRRRHALPEDAPLLGSFGFQTPIKRTDVVIRTLARPEVAGVHLVVGGEPSPTCRLEETAREAGVADRVHFLGFLPFDEFESAIAATDVCLNLRYPTAGETSASLLRILAVGKPTVVSDYAQSVDLPDEVTVKVPLGEEEEEVLAARLAELLGDSGRLREMGEAARRHVIERHHPARAAAATAEALADFAAVEPRRLERIEPTATSFVSSNASVVGREFPTRFAGEMEVRGAEEPWPGGERRRLAVRLVNRGPLRWLPGEMPDGGVAVEVRLEGSDSKPELDAWLRLPMGLEPGQEHLFEFDVRRPLGRARLRIEPHVLGHQGFSGLGGPVWEREI